MCFYLIFINDSANLHTPLLEYIENFSLNKQMIWLSWLIEMLWNTIHPDDKVSCQEHDETNSEGQNDGILDIWPGPNKETLRPPHPIIAGLSKYISLYLLKITYHCSGSYW